jgi:hypothetical protein
MGAARNSVKPGSAQPRRNRKFADSLLERGGFELVWGFSCQEFLLVCDRFFVRSEKPFFVPFPASGFPERAEGGRRGRDLAFVALLNGGDLTDSRVRGIQLFVRN